MSQPNSLHASAGITQIENNLPSVSPHRRIRATALGALAAVVFVLAVGMRLELRAQEDSVRDARLLNIAGRQRMLSERIARLSVTASDPDASQPLTAALSQLQAEADELTGALQPIMGGDHGAHRLMIRQYAAAERSRQSLLRLGRELLASPVRDSARSAEVSRTAIANQGAANDLVEALQRFSENRVRSAMAIVRYALAVTLLIAILLAVFLIEPLVRMIRRQYLDSTARTDDLKMMSLAVEQASSAVIYSDADFRITWVNQGFSRITGYTAAEVVGKSTSAVLQSERTDRAALEHIRRTLRSGHPSHVALVNRKRDGSDFWFDLDIQPRYDAAGTLIGFLGIGADITQRVEEKERLALIFSTLSQGLLLISHDGRVLECNPAAERILGMPASELLAMRVGDPGWEIIRTDGSPFPPEEGPVSQTIKTGESHYNVTYGLRFRGGVRRWVSVNSAAQRDAQGKIASVVVSLTDVTETYEQNTRMELVVSSANLGTWDVHVPTGRVIYNERFARMLGYSVDELNPDLSIFEQSLHPDEREIVQRALQAHLEGTSPEYRQEHRLRRRDGSWAWVIGAGQVTERGMNGEAIRMVGANVDVSQTKELETRALEAQQRYDAAIEGTSDGLWTWEVGARDIWFSPRCWQLLGFHDGIPHGEMQLAQFHEALHASHRQETLRLLNDVITQNTACDTEIRLRVRTGEYRHFRLRCKAQRSTDNRTVRIAGSIQDIETEKAAEMALLRTTAQLEDAQAVARLGSWSYDFESGDVDWSRQTYKLFGLDRAAGTPTYPEALSHYAEADRGLLDAAVMHAARTGQPYSLVLRTLSGHDDVRYVRGEGRAIRNEKGDVCGLFGTVSDVTAEIEREEALQNARAEIEGANLRLLETNRGLEVQTARASDMAHKANLANLAKSEFLANMSHEIRTPLTAILGFVDVLSDELIPQSDQPRSIGALETIRRAGEHLLSVINDILDLSKIDAGKLDVTRIETSLPTLLLDVDSLMRSRAASRGVALRTILTSPIPERICSDPTRLRQILVNLIGNAAKFTEAGKIEIRASTVTRQGEAMFRIEIEDTGPGMTVEQTSNLFQAFSQADASVTRRYGGTGLGLTISRRLAELMGGDVRLDHTAPGWGSQFSLELPLVTVQDATMIDNLSQSPGAPRLMMRSMTHRCRSSARTSCLPRTAKTISA